MMDQPLTQEEYDTTVSHTAKIIQKKLEDYDMEESEAVFETIDGHEYVMKYHLLLPVLQYADNKPREWQNFVADDESNHWHVLEAMAFTAFRQDVYDALHRLREVREELGEVLDIIIDAPVWAEGEGFDYQYEENAVYTLVAVDDLGGEYNVYDPDGVKFEVISPDAIIEQSDKLVDEFAFKNFLDEMCCKREHERKND